MHTPSNPIVPEENRGTSRARFNWIKCLVWYHGLGLTGKTLSLSALVTMKKTLLEGKLTARISFPRAASALSLFDFFSNPMMIVENTKT
jgi:hypothetical protein